MRSPIPVICVHHWMINNLQVNTITFARSSQPLFPVEKMQHNLSWLWYTFYQFVNRVAHWKGLQKCKINASSLKSGNFWKLCDFWKSCLSRLTPVRATPTQGCQGCLAPGLQKLRGGNVFYVWQSSISVSCYGAAFIILHQGGISTGRGPDSRKIFLTIYYFY